MAESPREERQFPIQSTTNGLRQIPWAMIAPHEAQAKANHDQDLETLACRQGLCACEAMAVLKDRKWVSVQPHENAEALLREMVDQWRAERPTAREERIAALLNEKRELESKLAQVEFVLEATAEALKGQEVSDFAESFWCVREVRDLRAELSASHQREADLTRQLEQMRARAIVAEQHKLLDRLGKSSYQEVVEQDLRITLAETEVRAEVAEARIASLHEALRMHGIQIP